MNRIVSIVTLLALAVTFMGCQSVQMIFAKRFTEPPPPPIPEGVLAIRKIPYVQTPQGPLYLDVYRPETIGDQRLPVVLYLFGGGWMMGNRNQLQRVDAQLLAPRGYAVVTADYRLSSVATFPAQIHDVKAAIRWIRANAEQQGFDPRRIGVWGPSAGGHLAALAGTSGDILALEGELNPDGLHVSTRVQAVVDYFGPTDLSLADEQRLPNGAEYDVPGSFATKFIGGPLASNPELVQLANPIRYVTPEDPPFLIVHGDADPIVPFGQSEILVEALEAAGVDVTLRRVEGGKHGTGGEFKGPDLWYVVVDFFDRHLQPEAR